MSNLPVLSFGPSGLSLAIPATAAGLFGLAAGIAVLALLKALQEQSI